MDTDVVIIGAGPVGLTLAIDLAQRGVDVTVLELRHRGEPPSVKCNHVSATIDGDFPAPGSRFEISATLAYRRTIRTTLRFGRR